MRPKPEHGTRSRYARPNLCRCDECKQAERDYQRAWARQKRAKAKALAAAAN